MDMNVFLKIFIQCFSYEDVYVKIVTNSIKIIRKIVETVALRESVYKYINAMFSEPAWATL